MELWDLLDGDRRPLGRTHVRGEHMEPGTFHLVVYVWTVNSNKQILVTLRHPQKEEYPDFWENTAGSALAGEKSRQAAVRELYEETGINAQESELTLLGVRKEKSQFADTYIVRKDTSLGELTLQEGETVDARWITLAELDELIKSNRLAPPVVQRLALVREDFEAFLNYETAD